MFTFGRDHEKRSALAYVRKSEQAFLLVNMIDSVHDLLEGKASEAETANAIRAAFIEGGSGVWESSSSWLRKVGAEYALIKGLWLEFAQHPSANVRYRVACCLDGVPSSLFSSIATQLVEDKSKKVSTMAQSRVDERGGI